jgi:hypothetical protein
MIDWSLSKTESELIIRIVSRRRMQDPKCNSLQLNMDLVTCHKNGCPLDLVGLLDASDADFTHDIIGIQEHILRTDGSLQDFFLPRFAASQQRMGVES